MYWTTPSGTRYQTGSPATTRFRQSVEETSLEGLISFKAGHTRASGTKIEKKDLWGNDHSGWVTLSTSVIEGLNVFEVITADRVVAQVSTEHAMEKGHVPKVL